VGWKISVEREASSCFESHMGGALEKAGWRKWGWGGEMKSDMQTKHGGTKKVSLTGTG